MTAQAGDLIVVESERVAQPVRRGVIEEVLQQEATLPNPLGRRPYQHLHPVRRVGEDREAEEGAESLAPPSDEAAVLFGHLRPERRAGFAGAAPHPRGVVAVGKARVRELKPDSRPPRATARKRAWPRSGPPRPTRSQPTRRSAVGPKSRRGCSRASWSARRGGRAPGRTPAAPGRARPLPFARRGQEPAAPGLQPFSRPPCPGRAARVLRYLIDAWGSSTNFFAAPLSKSLYPCGASSRVMTVALTAFAICTLSWRMACINLR